MREVRIAPKEQGKGRTFAATCLATVEGDALWDGGMSNTDDMRPVWAMFAGSEQELRSFIANVTLGRKILTGEGRSSYLHKERMELLKSAGYQTTWQRETEGAVVTVFLPDLFRLDPGMVDPSGARFIVLPSNAWIAKQSIESAPIVDHVLKLGCQLERAALEQLVPTSFLFCSYLDRRVRAPLVSDGRFYLQVLLASLAAGLASWSIDAQGSYGNRGFGQHSHLQFREIDTKDVGLAPGIAFQGSHEAIETMLAEQVTLFFRAHK